MQQEDSTNSLNVMTIWVGQLLIYALKCDVHDLLILRKDFVSHFRELTHVGTNAVMDSSIKRAINSFCSILGKRYSWQEEATALLEERISNCFVPFFAEQDFSHQLSDLRTINAWSGLSSCLKSKSVFPLSLLDYALDVIMPIVAPDLIRVLCKSIDELFANTQNDVLAIQHIDQCLSEVSKRICFNGNLDADRDNEIKLAILMHLPKDEQAFSIKTGFAYKLVQMQYAHMEVK